MAYSGNGNSDYVYLRDLQLSAIVGQDAWGRSDKPQPVLLSVKWYQNLSGTNDLQDTLSYSKMTKDIVQSIESRRGGFPSAHNLAEFILYVAVDKQWRGLALSIVVHLPKAILHAANGLKFFRSHHLQEPEPTREPFGANEIYPRTVIEDIRLPCIIGVNAHERERKQTVRIDMTIEEHLEKGSADGISSHWRGLVQHAVEVS